MNTDPLDGVDIAEEIRKAYRAGWPGPSAMEDLAPLGALNWEDRRPISVKGPEPTVKRSKKGKGWSP